MIGPRRAGERAAPKRRAPVGGLVLAVAGAASLIFITGNGWLALAVLLVWAGSLFLDRQEPVVTDGAPVEPRISRNAMRDLIEPLSLPYLVVRRGRVILANAAARETLGPHVLEQDARIALRHPEAVRVLERGGAGSALVRGLTGPRSIWNVSLRPIDEDTAMVELVNRTAEADISRAHTDFVANASHELRTPLSSIIGYIETLLETDRPVEPATVVRFQQIVLREARRLQALVDDLMSLSRIEAEKHDLPAQSVDLGELVEAGVSSLASLHGKERFVIDRDPKPMMVRGDRSQLDQLLRNLVENALKYGAKDRPVEIGLHRRGNGFVLSVADHGDGIAPEHIPHLTRRFYRTDPGRSRAEGGTGLGLAIVKHIVERHRGRLDITSTVGEGTTVTVRLNSWSEQ